VSIQNYEALARYVFRNLNPATDIYFHKGRWMCLTIVAANWALVAKCALTEQTNLFEEKDESFQIFSFRFPVG